MDNPIVVEARKHLDKVDFVIDLYDKSFIWATDEVIRTAEYTPEEFMKLRTYDTLDKCVNQEAYAKELANQLIQKHGNTSVLCNTKSGKKIRLTIEYHIFEFNGGWYRAAKALKVERQQ
jgi:hypothetical protein